MKYFKQRIKKLSGIGLIGSVFLMMSMSAYAWPVLDAGVVSAIGLQTTALGLQTTAQTTAIGLQTTGQTTALGLQTTQQTTALGLQTTQQTTALTLELTTHFVTSTIAPEVQSKVIINALGLALKPYNLARDKLIDDPDDHQAQLIADVYYGKGDLNPAQCADGKSTGAKTPVPIPGVAITPGRGLAIIGTYVGTQQKACERIQNLRAMKLALHDLREARAPVGTVAGVGPAKAFETAFDAAEKLATGNIGAQMVKQNLFTALKATQDKFYADYNSDIQKLDSWIAVAKDIQDGASKAIVVGPPASAKTMAAVAAGKFALGTAINAITTTKGSYNP